MKRLVCLLLVVSFAVVAGAGEGPDLLRCRLNARDSLTTWLASRPLPLRSEKQFGEDLLAPFGGETKMLPVEGSFAAGDKKLEWKPLIGPMGFLNLNEACLTDSESVFYLYCLLQLEKDGPARITCEYWANIRVWIAGQLVIDGGKPTTMNINMKSAVVNLPGKPVPMLVKIGSSQKQCLLALTVNQPKGAAPAQVLLPVKKQTGADPAGWLTKCISIRLAGVEDFVEPGETHKLAMTVISGFPVFDAPLRAKMTVLDSEDKKLDELKPIELTTAALTGPDGPTAEWKIHKSWKEPYYTVRAELSVDGKSSGQTEQRFFSVAGIEDYGNKLFKRVAKIHEAAQKDGTLYTNEDLAYAELKLEKAAVLLKDRLQVADFGRRVIAEVTEAKEILQLLEDSKRPKRPVYGKVEFAYISDIDDTVQPYYAYVPTSYAGTKPVPCVLYLHGYTPTLNKINWEQLPWELTRWCDQYGYVLVAPFARSNTDFQSVGEVDVMHVLALAKKKWNIDPNRVFLFGYSMGGMGAWTIGGHYPDQFAGIVSLAGRNNWYMWHSLIPEQVPPYKRFLADMEFASNYFESFRNTGVMCYQGENDMIVQPEQSQQAISKLKGMGFDAALKMVPNESHWIAESVLEDDGSFKWMAARSRPDAPRQVSLKTYSLRYRSAYWIRIDEFIEWGTPATVDAVITDDKKIEVKTSNVASVAFYPPAKLLPEGERPAVICNGKGMDVAASGDGGWRISIAQLPAPPTGLRKSPRVCGPAKEAFNSRFVFVWGSLGDLHEDKHLKNTAHFAAGDWGNFTRSFPELLKVVKDKKLTAEDRKTCNLILFGTPQNNSVLAELAPKLPIQIEQGKYTIGDKVFQGDNIGLVMIYPNPENRERYVYIQSGLYYGTALDVNHKFDLLPDFIVFTENLDADDTNSALCAGFFDINWQLSKSLTWHYDGKGTGRLAPLPDLKDVPNEPKEDANEPEDEEDERP